MIEALLHIGFLIGAIFFVQQQPVSEFIEGTTSYSESQERISLQDLPTVTYYFPESGETLVYGDDFLIEAKVSDDSKEKTVTLIENRGVLTLSGLTMLVKKMVRSDLETCYMIASDWNAEASVNVRRRPLS